ncbi:MAG: outer membrane beta-barrel family protein [Prevotellaceae bacterium]|jgi:hypothetical protein|nr:outer membrane beta-barrel family protein [Prevotellaceae bacterium]
MKQILSLLTVCLCCTALSAQEVSTRPQTGRTPDHTLSADSILTGNSRLDSLYRNLPEVLIKGERPVVKIDHGKLVYDLPRLIRKLPVDNIYDAIKELPGVIDMNDQLTLAGRSVTVILNDQVTNMSAEQLRMLLKSMPASRIAGAEVMYNAPARYRVKGAVINILLTQNDEHTRMLQGELNAQYRQKHDGGTAERISLLYGHDKFSADLLYTYNHGRSYMLTDKQARHTLADGTVYPIDNHEMQRSLSNSHVVRLGADYQFAQQHRLSVVYDGTYSSYHGQSAVSGTQQATNRRIGDNRLHSGRIDYQAPFGLKAGAALTYYHSPSEQSLSSVMAGESLAFNTAESQRINAWNFYLSQTHTLKHNWSLNYGATYSTSVDNSYQTYKEIQSTDADKPDNMRSRRREQTLNLYGGVSRNFDKLSLDASLAVQYYNTPVWDRWDVFPVFNILYMPAPGRVWQLSLGSSKSYPGYWEMQNNISYLSGYSEIQGNPLLKPSVAYNLSLTHVLKGKYVFTAWYQHTKDYFVQTLYQAPDRLVEIYKTVNYDYAEQAGIQATLPFTAGTWLNSRLSLIGVWQHEKNDDFWDIPFDRAVFWGMASMTNVFTLSAKPDLRLTLTGRIRSLAHQGIYDLPASGNVDAFLQYTFAKGNGIVKLYGNDLFETAQIDPRMRFRTQHVTNNYSCYREIGVSFTWKFGGYKEKKREEVDKSRFRE